MSNRILTLRCGFVDLPDDYDEIASCSSPHNRDVFSPFSVVELHHDTIA